MKELNTQEVKGIQIDILKIVTGYCDQEGLVYFLGYGTLLGAVRHKGYIPWDDDIDIIMPRKDYEKFIKEFKLNDYDIKSHYKDLNYPYTFAKVSYEKSILIENTDLKYKIGINIDIFPLDKFPESTKQIQSLYREIKFYESLLKIKYIVINPNRRLYKNIILKLGKIVLNILSYEKIINKINEKAMLYKDIENISNIGCIVDSYGIKDIMDKSIFDNKTKIEFEGYSFYAPKKHHEYLTNIYGEYMKLPPEEDRKTHHDFEAFLK